MNVLSLLISWILLLAPALAEVASITANNFGELVAESQETWVLEFFSPRCGTCKEFSPLFHRLSGDHTALQFGQVDIDEPEGMQLALETGAIEEGVPSVRAYKRPGDILGDLVWAGDEAPPFEELNSALLTAVGV